MKLMTNNDKAWRNITYEENIIFYADNDDYTVFDTFAWRLFVQEAEYIIIGRMACHAEFFFWYGQLQFGYIVL